MRPEDLSSQLEELSARVEKLERRLSVLEHPRQQETPGLEPIAVPALVTAGAGGAASGQAQPNLFSVFGRAVLGIAGAYLLRAAAESGILAAWFAVTLALAYAGAWLVWAAWPDGQSRLSRHFYGLTAALILAPLLWEVTVRFRMLEPPVTAALVAAFALLAMALAWRGNLSSVIWVGMLTAVITSIILMVATREPVPFTASVLAMAAMSEAAASQSRWLVLRAMVALAADLAALVTILILGDVNAIPQEYHAADTGVLLALVASLLVIYAASLAVRTLVLRFRVTSFEAAQTAVAVLLAGWGVLRITQGLGRPAVGVCCLVAGAGCYFAAFGRSTRESERRNFRFYAVCAVAFVMAGSFLALPSLALVVWLCVAAAAATALGVRVRSPALDLHGVVYLSGAVIASGLFGYAGRALAGGYPSGPGVLRILAAATALACAAMVSRYRGERAGERLLRLLPAILAVYTAAALAVAGLAGLIAHGGAPTLPELAVVRTVVTCAAALVLGFAGARFERRELVWMAYAAAVLGCLKLVVEDLRIGSTQSLAASLLIYGAVLILIPRLVRAGKREA